MAKPSLYLETSIIGCLTNWPSQDITRESHRQSTHRWWNERRLNYDLFISQVVMDEISEGDPAAVKDRLAVVASIPMLPMDQAIISTATDLVRVHALPPKSLQDAFHIAVAAHHRIDILPTWNCTHIANPHIIKLVRRFLDRSKSPLSEITTPESLLGDNDV